MSMSLNGEMGYACSTTVEYCEPENIKHRRSLLLFLISPSTTSTTHREDQGY
jgi:hypothetical protein